MRPFHGKRAHEAVRPWQSHEAMTFESRKGGWRLGGSARGERLSIADWCGTSTGWHTGRGRGGLAFLPWFLALHPQVVGLSKLRTKYESHEAKRQLCGSYDLFLADERVLPSLPKLLGGLERDANFAC